MNPLVSVVCLSFNHKSFLRQAIESVLSQTYSNLQIILIDDCSTDGSQQELQAIASENSKLELILLPVNIGNCKAFNQALKKVQGDFVIDFATDDVMLPTHIERIVSHFQTLDDSYGVVFTDATYIDTEGNSIRPHFDFLLKKKFIDSIPQGDVFRKVLTTYFIPGPTMIVRKKVMDELNGYDESLSYEDFDFWIRSSRKFRYAFLNENNLLIRKSKTSMSANPDRQLASNYQILQKAKLLCRDEEDITALKKRVLYEFRHAVFSSQKEEAKRFADFLIELKAVGAQFYLLKIVNTLPLRWQFLKRLYYQIKF